jgi:hypothetical protein
MRNRVIGGFIGVFCFYISPHPFMSISYSPPALNSDSLGAFTAELVTIGASFLITALPDLQQRLHVCLFLRRLVQRAATRSCPHFLLKTTGETPNWTVEGKKLGHGAKAHIKNYLQSSLKSCKVYKAFKKW